MPSVQPSPFTLLTRGAGHAWSTTRAVSPIDCLIPIYLERTEEGTRATLRKTSQPLVSETLGKIGNTVFVFSVHTTGAEVQAALMMLRDWCPHPAEAGQLDNGDHVIMMAIDLDQYTDLSGMPDVADLLMLSGGDFNIYGHIRDCRAGEDRTPLVFSPQISHRDLVLALNEPYSRKEISACTRAQAIMDVLIDDLDNGPIVRAVQAMLLQLPGATVPAFSICPAEVTARAEDLLIELDMDDAIPDLDDMQDRILDEMNSRQTELLAERIIMRIARDIVRQIAAPEGY